VKSERRKNNLKAKGYKQKAKNGSPATKDQLQKAVSKKQLRKAKDKRL
jgi:hypothetical protein